MCKIITFTGFLQTGKTTSANFIESTRYSFAAPIKHIARTDFRWNEKKDGLGRKLLQEIGSVGRNYYSDIWVDKLRVDLMNDSFSHVITIDDLRYSNEAEMLKELDAMIIRINRPGYGSSNHESEKGIPDIYIDRTICNNGTLLELKEKVLQCL